MTTLGLKNINLLTKEQYDGISDLASDELYAVSGSGIGFPSSDYEDLTLGASDTEYTAPANGWFYVNKTSGGSNQWLALRNKTASALSFNSTIYSSNFALEGYVPARKGDVIAVQYTLSGSTNKFRFIYAEGE